MGGGGMCVWVCVSPSEQADVPACMSTNYSVYG